MPYPIREAAAVVNGQRKLRGSPDGKRIGFWLGAALRRLIAGRNQGREDGADYTNACDPPLASGEMVDRVYRSSPDVAQAS